MSVLLYMLLMAETRKRDRGGGIEATPHEIRVLHVMTRIQIIFVDQTTQIKTHCGLPYHWELEC